MPALLLFCLPMSFVPSTLCTAPLLSTSKSHNGADCPSPNNCSKGGTGAHENKPACHCHFPLVFGVPFQMWPHCTILIAHMFLKNRSKILANTFTKDEVLVRLMTAFKSNEDLHDSSVSRKVSLSLNVLRCWKTLLTVHNRAPQSARPRCESEDEQTKAIRLCASVSAHKLLNFSILRETSFAKMAHGEASIQRLLAFPGMH